MKKETAIIILYLLSPLSAFVGMILSINLFNLMSAEFVTNYFYYCLIASGLIILSFYFIPFALARYIDKNPGVIV